MTEQIIFTDEFQRIVRKYSRDYSFYIDARMTFVTKDDYSGCKHSIKEHRLIKDYLSGKMKKSTNENTIALFQSLRQFQDFIIQAIKSPNFDYLQVVDFIIENYNTKIPYILHDCSVNQVYLESIDDYDKTLVEVLIDNDYFNSSLDELEDLYNFDIVQILKDLYEERGITERFLTSPEPDHIADPIQQPQPQLVRVPPVQPPPVEQKPIKLQRSKWRLLTKEQLENKRKMAALLGSAIQREDLGLKPLSSSAIQDFESALKKKRDMEQELFRMNHKISTISKMINAEASIETSINNAKESVANPFHFILDVTEELREILFEALSQGVSRQKLYVLKRKIHSQKVDTVAKRGTLTRRRNILYRQYVSFTMGLHSIKSDLEKTLYLKHQVRWEQFYDTWFDALKIVPKTTHPPG